MSGYAVPPGSQPGARRSARQGPALPVLELVGLGLAGLAFVIAFLPWAQRRPQVVGVTLQGWDLPLPTAATVVLLVAALLLVAPLLAGGAADADGDAAGGAHDGASPLPALLAVLAAVLFLVHAVSGAEILGVEFERGIGVWLGLLLGLGAAAVLVLSWLQRTGRLRKRAPAAPAGQWGGAGAARLGPAAARLRPAAAGRLPGSGARCPRAAVRAAAAARLRSAAGLRAAATGPADRRPARAGPAVRAGAVPAERLPVPGPGLPAGLSAPAGAPARPQRWLGVPEPAAGETLPE